MKMRTPYALLALALTLVLVAPANAGTVYVALAYNGAIGGTNFETVLQVTNPSAQAKTFTVKFLAENTDGSDRPEGETLTPVSVPAGTTRIIKGVAPAGATGMLEVTGANELVFRSILRPTDLAAVGGELPVINFDKVAGAQTDIHLQGLRRSTNVVSGYGVVNLDPKAINCAVDIENAGGGPLTNTVTITVNPLAVLFWEDVLPLVGNQAGNNIQIKTRCSGRAYAFGTIVNTRLGDVSAISPSTSLDSFLTPPGVKLPCPAGSVCFERAGLFHTPTGSNPVFRAKIPLQNGTDYRIVRVSLKVRHGGWFGPLNSGIHNFFWIFDTDWQGTYGYMNARGPSKNVVTMLTKAGIGGGTSRPSKPFGLSPGSTYLIDYVYNTKTGNIKGTVSTSGGQVLVDLSDVTRVNRVGNSGTLDLWVGNPDERSHGFFEVPGLNWNFSDLRVEVAQ